MKKNKYVGGDWDEFLKKQKQDPELALAFQVEYDRLQLARQVKALRGAHDLSQEKLAELVGTKQPAIARLEAGNALPRLDLLERIAHALGAHLDVRFVPNQV
jgi:DNA-binding XRE family transcriptional regulator